MSLWRRLFGPEPAPTPRMRDVLERLDELEADVAGLRKRVLKLQGLVTGGMRRDKADPDAQDAPGATIAEPDGPRPPPNLFRRLRGF